jgi:tRNA(Ile)-lysidine synthase
MCQTWHVPCVAGFVDVRQLAQTTGTNLEAAARQARYQFLAQVAHDYGASHVATAHHANDQAETIFMHILRGAGSAGLQGMAYQTPLPVAPNITLIRPMLDIPRTELEAYCQQYQLQPRMDETNDDTSLLRNVIRLDILPRLAHINPQIHRALARLGEIVRVDHAFIQHQFEQIILPQQTVTATQVTFPRIMFRDLHPALQRRWLIESVRHLRGNTDELSHERIQAALQTLPQAEVGTKIQFPHAVEVVISYEHIVVRDAKQIEFPAAYGRLETPAAITVSVPGNTNIPNHGLLHATTNTPDRPHQTLWLPPNAQVSLRTRRPGDVFAPAGLHGKHQKLKKWFIDHKIPQPLRDRLPLLIINGEIAALLLPQWILSHTFIYPQPHWEKINFIIAIKDK